MKQDQDYTGHGFADPSHRERYWALVKHGTAASLNIAAPWLKRQVLDRLPNLRREFDGNRAPHLRIQMREGGEGRGGQQPKHLAERSGFAKAPDHGLATGSRMVKSDQPELKPIPPQATRHAVDKATFNRMWLDEHWRDISTRIVEPESSRGMAPEQDRRPQTRSSPEPSW